METITLQNLPEPLVKRIEERARRTEASMDQTVIEMLVERQEDGRSNPRAALESLAGTWSPDEADAFDAELARLRTGDPD